MARTKLFLNKPTTKVQGIPKLRHKEEKKVMLKMCMKKLKRIVDTESLLCKSVLIVNTIRNLRQYSQEYVTLHIEDDRQDRDEMDTKDDNIECDPSFQPPQDFQQNCQC